MCKSATVLTPRPTPAPALSSVLIWCVCEINCESYISTFWGENNYHKLQICRLPPSEDTLGCSVVAIKQIHSPGCDGARTTGGSFYLFIFCSCWGRLRLLMKRRPVRMRTQWGVEWGLSIHPLPGVFVSSSPSSLCIWTSCSPHLLVD